MARKRPIRLSVFNHKGGVGKTTLTMNLAASLARAGRRVLLIDSDPQCNLTSYLVADDVVDDLLDRSDTKDGRTVWSALKPISEGVGGVRSTSPIETAVSNLFLVPGDVRLAEFESDLTEFWGQSLQRKVRGFRGTTALSELVVEVADSVGADYVFYDSGPNIGPLNRAILLDCDYFLVPVACDLFSLRALKTLGRTLVEWITSWATISELAPEETYLLKGLPSFLGYIPEGFKVYGGQIAKQHSSFLTKIDREISSQLVQLLRDVDPALAVGRMQQFKLGEIKHFGALVPASQGGGVPLFDANAGSPEQREEARAAFASLAERVEGRIESLTSE